MNTLISKTLESKFDSTEDPTRFTATITTNKVDRDGEVVIPAGMNSKEYERNPVLLYAHDAAKPIGKMLSMRRNDDTIAADFALAPRPETHEGEWLPDTVAALMRFGALRGVSIGFAPQSGGMRVASKADTERYGTGVKRVFSKWTLFEVSVVSIPANQDALINAIEKGIVSSASVKALGLESEMATRSLDKIKHRILITMPARKNCGIGPDGFEPGNDCASGDGSGSSEDGDNDRTSRTITTDDGRKIQVYESDEESPIDALQSQEARDIVDGIKVTWEDALGKVTFDAIEKTPTQSIANKYTGDDYGYFTHQDSDVSEGLEDFGSNHEPLKFGGMSDSEYEEELATIDSRAKREKLDPDTVDELKEELQDLRTSRAEKALAKMREELEVSCAESTLDCCIRLMRGVRLSKAIVDSIIKTGHWTHNGVNSWTTDKSTLKEFTDPNNPTVIVLKNPKVGWANKRDRLKEKEVIRPPASLKITKVERTLSGTLIHVEEAEEYKK